MKMARKWMNTCHRSHSFLLWVFRILHFHPPRLNSFSRHAYRKKKCLFEKNCKSQIYGKQKWTVLLMLANDKRLTSLSKSLKPLFWSFWQLSVRIQTPLGFRFMIMLMSVITKVWTRWQQIRNNIPDKLRSGFPKTTVNIDLAGMGREGSRG